MAVEPNIILIRMQKRKYHLTLGSTHWCVLVPAFGFISPATFKHNGWRISTKLALIERDQGQFPVSDCAFRTRTMGKQAGYNPINYVVEGTSITFRIQLTKCNFSSGCFFWVWASRNEREHRSKWIVQWGMADEKESTTPHKFYILVD